MVVGKNKCPVGRREETVRLTLFRHRSAFACVRACQCVSAVQVRAYLKKHPRKSNGNGYANARNTHLKLRAFIRSAHMVQKRIELTYSQKNTSIQMSNQIKEHTCYVYDMKCVLNSLPSRTDYTQASNAKDKSNARNKHTHSHKQAVIDASIF